MFQPISASSFVCLIVNFCVNKNLSTNRHRGELKDFCIAMFI